jgi:hypothetical protein
MELCFYAYLPAIFFTVTEMFISIVAIVCLSTSRTGLLFRFHPFKVISSHDTILLNVILLA